MSLLMFLMAWDWGKRTHSLSDVGKPFPRADTSQGLQSLLCPKAVLPADHLLMHLPPCHAPSRQVCQPHCTGVEVGGVGRESGGTERERNTPKVTHQVRILWRQDKPAPINPLVLAFSAGQAVRCSLRPPIPPPCLCSEGHGNMA